MSLPFAPRDGGTVTISASTTSADEAIDANCHVLRIYNAASDVAHIKVGTGSALTATTADFPVAGGGTAVIRISSQINIVAAILGSGTGNVYVTPGEGGSAV